MVNCLFFLTLRESVKELYHILQSVTVKIYYHNLPYHTFQSVTAKATGDKRRQEQDLGTEEKMNWPLWDQHSGQEQPVLLTTQPNF